MADIVLTTDGKSALVSGGLLAALAGGSIDIRDASLNVLATITLQSPAASESSGVLTLLGVPLSTTGTAAAGTGTDAASANFKTSGGTSLFTGTCTVTGGGGAVTLNNLSIADGQTVQVTSGTLTPKTS